MLIQEIMETKNGIKFYQVLVTDWHESSLDATYKHVFNYATLAEAMRCPFYVGDDNKHVSEGEKFVDPITGVEKYQIISSTSTFISRPLSNYATKKWLKTKEAQRYLSIKC